MGDVLAVPFLAVGMWKADWIYTLYGGRFTTKSTSNCFLTNLPFSSLPPSSTNPYVHIISSTAKLIIDNVFHNVRFFLLSIVENGCTYADISEVVFRLGTNIFSAFHIIAQGFLYQERVFQIVNVLFYSVSFYGYPL